MPKASTPVPTTKLTRDYYKSRGWMVTYVQRSVQSRQPNGVVRTLSFDAWGFADFLMFPDPDRIARPRYTIKAVNSCAISDIGAHVRKFVMNARAWAFLKCSKRHDLVIAGWARDAGHNQYRAEFRRVTLADFDEAMKPGVFSFHRLPAPRQKKAKPVPVPAAEAVPTLFDGENHAVA